MTMQELTTFARQIGLFMGSGRCHRTMVSWRRNSLPASAGQKRIVENRWREFFSDPSKWWDHRSAKENSRYPDFKHKMTEQALWLNGKFNPPWVKAELAAMAPGTVQLSIFLWNARLARCVKGGQYENTMKLFEQMQCEGMDPDQFTFVTVLNACASLQSLEEGRCIHRMVIQSGCELDVFVGSSLIGMYAKCGSIEEALTVFNKMRIRSMATWNMMILGHLKCGQGQRALELCRQMQQEGVEPDPITFVGFLNACGSVMALEGGRHVHEQIIQRGFESNVFVGSSLIDMYAKCGSIEDAWRVFNKMRRRDLVAWTAMIHGFVRCGHAHRALELSRRMHCEGIQPDPLMFVGLLNACASVGALEEGRHIHEQIIQRLFEADVFVGSSLIGMYAKCGSIDEALSVFNKMPIRNGASWNAMIHGYIKSGQAHKALDLSRQMQHERMQLDPSTLVAFLNVCASIGALEDGRRIHEQIIERGIESDVCIGSSLVDMYSKCGSIEDAQQVFKNMPTRNVVSWNSLIQGYVKHGRYRKALDLSGQMQSEGVEPDHITFVGLLNACANMKALEQGRKIHEQIIERSCEGDIFVGNSLVDMYGKCGSIENAWRVFDKMPKHDLVSWNAMIHGFVKCGQSRKALELTTQMQVEGVEPDPCTFVGLLNACANAGALEEGRRVNEQIIESGFESDAFVGSRLVDMYSKCGSIQDARRVFDKMPVRDAFTWSSMIQGYLKCGQRKMALELSRQMQREGVQVDPVKFMPVLV